MFNAPTLVRVNLSLRGLLQGVGFRPFVFQLANEIGLNGWVLNTSKGVSIEVEGDREGVDQFLFRLKAESPPNSIFHDIQSSYHDPLGYKRFEIRNSDNSGDASTLVLPDIATCLDCIAELFDPSNRRYLYPFINCTHCGPRFSIIESLPYDRQRTSMKQFMMCEACQKEYDDPDDRRFHAQPNACNDCGPHLELWESSSLYKKEEALEKAVTAIKGGLIMAIKGLGGFHLMVNASDGQAVRRLRKNKNREEKPFALMFPNLASVKNECEVSPLEERLLLSPEAPIVILKRRQMASDAISNAVAPTNPYLGIMLPSTPLHHVLMNKLNSPVVATSGNISDETICFENDDAFIRLKCIADDFLVHNRTIVRHVDDSIVRALAGAEQILRRARGYAPLPVTVKENVPSMIGVGGYLKNTVALAKEKNIFISQHIGDLGNSQTNATFESSCQSLTELCEIRTASIACDFHPDYPSTQWAEKNVGRIIPVQHHVAHVFSCMAEHGLEGPLLGIAWDGSGYGLDGTIWGGEFFHVTEQSVHRIACLRPFPLPGGDASIKEPRRSALGFLYQIFGHSVFEQSIIHESFSNEEISILKAMLEKKINCPMTSSCGRLFDAVACMTGGRQINSFEGQAAMEFEFLTLDTSSESFYTVDLIEDDFLISNLKSKDDIPEYYNLNLKYQLDPSSLANEILEDIKQNRSRSLIAIKFHNALVESLVAIAKRVGEEQVILSGGCFQNRYLTERAIRRLKQEGFHPYWHQIVPPNDGGLALGQIYAASQYEFKKEACDVFSGTR